MKIVFVGLHNKPGFPPLCSTTKTGQVVDLIIGHFNNVEFEKKNIFPVEYLPHSEEREQLIDKFEVEDDAYYIALGKISTDAIERMNVEFYAAYHPGYILRGGLQRKENYIKAVVMRIESVLHQDQLINITK